MHLHFGVCMYIALPTKRQPGKITHLHRDARRPPANDYGTGSGAGGGAAGWLNIVDDQTTNCQNVGRTHTQPCGNTYPPFLHQHAVLQRSPEQPAYLLFKDTPLGAETSFLPKHCSNIFLMPWKLLLNLQQEGEMIFPGHLL